MVLTLRHFLIFITILLAGMNSSFSSYSQVVSPPEVFAAPRIKRSLTKDTQILSKSLTEGLTSDKEKFDVIFSWVVTNIRYDYKMYNSGRAIPELQLKKLLKRRKGVCTGYALLMDSLCFYSGVTSVSINGYTKGITFDVNDSLYFDNHTWNAVKLDNLWYLYDATWSSGRSAFEMNRLGKWRLKQLNKLSLHAREETRILRIRKKKNVLCGLEGGTELASTTEWVLPTPYRQLYWLIDLVPYRFKSKYRYVSSTNYYLTHPDVFVLNHFPNDPMWNLTRTINNLDEFRNDSTYYYGIKDQFRTQVREGRFCMECDGFLALDDIKKAKEEIKRAKEHLPQNPFVAAQSEMKVATLYYLDFIKEQDSTLKMQLFDSTVHYIKMGRSDFSASRKPASREYLFHNKKNTAKRNYLLQENKQKQRLYNSTFKAIQSRHQKIRTLQPKLKAFDNRTRTNRRSFQRAFSAIGSPISKEDKIKKMQSDLQTSMYRADSLSTLVTSLRSRVLEQTIDLWKGLLEQNGLFSPLDQLYFKDSYLRSISSMDSYDREIRLIRSQMKQLENEFQSRIQLEIIDRADSVYRNLKLLHQTCLKRNEQAIRSAKIMTKLNQSGVYPKEGLLTYKTTTLELMKEDICWKEDHGELFYHCSFLFKKFYRKSRFLKLMVSRNTAEEYKRHKRIQQEIRTTKNRIHDAISTNNRTLQIMRKSADEKRKKFLDARRG